MNSQTILFSAISYEINNNDYLRKNAELQLYKSGKIVFSDSKEKFSVVINNSEQAEKLLNKYGITNFGDISRGIKRGIEKAKDKLAEKTGIGREQSARRGARKRKVAETLRTASENMELQQKLLKDAAEAVSEVSPNTAEKIEKISKRGEKFKESAKKYSEKLDKDASVKVAEEYAKTQADLKEMQKDIIKNAESKESEHEDALNEITRIKNEIGKLKNKMHRAKGDKAKKEIAKEQREWEKKLEEWEDKVKKSELSDEELKAYKEAKRVLEDFEDISNHSENPITNAFKANLIKNFSIRG